MTAKSHGKISLELLSIRYISGVFPMSDSVDDPDIYWVDPQMRGVFPLDNFHVSRRLARRIRQKQYTVSINQHFSVVVTACANRAETWINTEIFDLYGQLHDLGHAHSIEVMDGTTLVGGVYGVSLNGAFFFLLRKTRRNRKINHISI